MCQCHAKANRPAIVLHIKRVVRQTQRLREIVYHGSDVVEGVIELLGIRPVAVSVTGIVWRNQMVVVGEPCQPSLTD